LEKLAVVFSKLRVFCEGQQLLLWWTLAAILVLAAAGSDKGSRKPAAFADGAEGDAVTGFAGCGCGVDDAVKARFENLEYQINKVN
jgi:hypothetical protein